MLNELPLWREVGKYGFHRNIWQTVLRAYDWTDALID